MMYAPQHEQILDKPFNLQPPQIEEAVVWEGAWKAACCFWKKVSEDKRITKGFSAIARKNLKIVESAREIFLRLP